MRVWKGGGGEQRGRENLPPPPDSSTPLQFYLTFANAHIIRERISSLLLRPESAGGRQSPKPLIEIPILSGETSARRHFTNREVLSIGQVPAAAVK